MNKKVILVVLDSLGVGALPDAPLYGDAGANTLLHILQARPETALPNLQSLGLLNLNTINRGIIRPRGRYGRLAALSAGKDTTTGHFELAGLTLTQPFPTFPNGFPAAFIQQFEAAIGRKTLCNLPYSGTKVINDYGPAHMESGAPIVYTSADSVFQIAAHEGVIPVDALYQICQTARALLTGPLGVGRVIARPFTGTPGAFERTGNRHDFAMEPPGETMLDQLQAQGRQVLGIGKISDIFAGRGITSSFPTKGNQEGIRLLLEQARLSFNGLLFCNLVDFDSKFGHRRDALGYSLALEEFDRCLPALIEGMGPEDLLLITGDHGCDPLHPGTDHTREHVPLLMYKKGIQAYPLGDIRGFSFVSQIVLSHLR